MLIEKVKVWNEVCRVLKPTGHLFLNVAPGKNNPFEIYDVIKQIDWKLQNSIICVLIDGYVRGYSTPTSSKRYLMNGWEHLFHFTQDGNTEIDLEQVEFHDKAVPLIQDIKTICIMSRETKKKW